MVNSAGEIDLVADAQFLNQLNHIPIFFGLPYDGDTDILNFLKFGHRLKEKKETLQGGIRAVGYN